MDKQQNDLIKSYFRSRNQIAGRGDYDTRWQPHELTLETITSNMIKPETIVAPYKITELMTFPEIKEYVKNNIEKFDDIFLVFMMDYSSDYADIILPEFVRRIEIDGKKDDGTKIRHNSNRMARIINKDANLFNYFIPVLKYLNSGDINDIIYMNNDLIDPIMKSTKLDPNNISTIINAKPEYLKRFSAEELNSITKLYLMKIFNKHPNLIDAYDWRLDTLESKHFHFLLKKQPQLANHPKIKNLVSNG